VTFNAARYDIERVSIISPVIKKGESTIRSKPLIDQNMAEKKLRIPNNRFI
jgi:hypothetical protein